VLFDVSSNGFNFIKQDVSPGEVHNIKVQAQFFASSTAGSSAEALLASRTVTGAGRAGRSVATEVCGCRARRCDRLGPTCCRMTGTERPTNAALDAECDNSVE
jgi:hypothetical protein